MPSVSQAKNMIKKALHGILDSLPGDAVTRELWVHFKSSCAFCSAPLNREAREGHRDHLMPQALGGSNHPANLVLACGSCNGDERRDGDWEAFLREKCRGDSSKFGRRHGRIMSWVKTHGGPGYQRNESLQRIVEQCQEPVFAALDEAVKELREVRDSGGQPIG